MLQLPVSSDSGLEVGVDEAGRGCLWGPLFAAAVLLPPEQDKWPASFRAIVNEINDSKKLSPKRRAKIYSVLNGSDLRYGIGRVESDEIDTLGATRGNQLAFRRALDALGATEAIHVRIDGVLDLAKTKPTETVTTEIDGDARFLSISTASILAKEARDTWVKQWCDENTEEGEKYDLIHCKGYGTLKHRQGIQKDGLHELHRRLYCRKLVPGLTVPRYQFVDDS